ncbi:MAG: hypothetical protein ACJAVI_006100 [Candidatus Azotimanducaceae bacterium]|jgi:hypothetical protein
MANPSEKLAESLEILHQLQERPLCHQPTDEFHWTQNNMRRAVAIRRFEFNNGAAVIRQ